MGTGLSAALLTQAEYAEWDALVAASPDGSVYAATAYLDTLCSAAGGRFTILGVRRDAELVGGIPLYERDSALGRYVAPRLLLYYLSPVLKPSPSSYPSERTSRHLKVLGTMVEALAARSYGRISLRCRSTIRDVRPFLAGGWQASPGYTYVVSFADLGQAWKRVEQNLRRLIDRCGSSGIAFTEDDDFDSFFRLHAVTMDRNDTGVYLPRAAFERYVRKLRALDLCRLYHARRPEGDVLASQLVLLGPGTGSHTVTAATGPEALKLGAAAFLRWKSFEALAALGRQANDLTDASLNSVAHFKSQLGGDLEACFLLEAPRSARYRLGDGVAGLYGGVRSAAGSLARRVLGRGAESE